MDKGVHLLQLTSSCVMYCSYTFFSVKYSHYIMHAIGASDDQICQIVSNAFFFDLECCFVNLVLP